MFFRSTDGKATAEKRYARYRSAVYQEAARSEAYPRKLRLDSITPAALRTYRDVWLHRSNTRRVDWNWPEEIAHWRNKCASRLEMAAWHEHHLCGLLIARTTSSKKTLYIEGIEGAPYSHPLKGSVILICIDAAEKYAQMLGANEIRIRDPDPAVVQAYTNQGYTLDSNVFPKRESYAYKLMGETA